MESNVTITPEQVDAIFESAEVQGDYILGLHKLVLPEWDDIKSVDGYPRVNHETGMYIREKAMEWDKADIAARLKEDPGWHPYMAGGQWGLNVGWGENLYLPDWVVSMADVTLEF
jgi:hypothetical protein